MESQNSKPIVLTQLSIIHDLSGIPVTAWERGKEPSLAGNACLTDAGLRQMFEKETESRALPVIFFENEFVFFGLLQASESVLCLGPVTRNTMKGVYAAQYYASNTWRCWAALPWNAR